MKLQFLHWGCIALFSTAAVSALLTLSLYHIPIVSAGDPHALARYVLLRLAAIAMAAPALTGLMLLVDFVTPGDWMKAIGDDPKACSYVMSAVVLVIGAIVCWA